MRLSAAVVTLLLSLPAPLFAAVGCDLNDPDRDVARLFPGSTGYKTEYLSIKDKGGADLLAEVEQRLGDKFKGLYETIDVPYTLYQVLEKGRPIGYIHGVNQKGKYGGIQVFLSLDLEGKIKAFYIQKLTSRQAKELRSADFARQFVGLRLSDFQKYDPVSGKVEPGSRVAGIKNPSAGAEADFRTVLRAVKKNLILMDAFVFKEKKTEVKQEAP
jgi:hypothetical protein